MVILQGLDDVCSNHGQTSEGPLVQDTNVQRRSIELLFREVLWEGGKEGREGGRGGMHVIMLGCSTVLVYSNLHNLCTIYVYIYIHIYRCYQEDMSSLSYSAEYSTSKMTDRVQVHCCYVHVHQMLGLLPTYVQQTLSYVQRNTVHDHKVTLSTRRPINVCSYHIKGDDGLWEVGIVRGVLDVLAPHHRPPALNLHQGRGDSEQLEPLHVPHSPAQHLDSGLLQDWADPAGDDVVGVRGRGRGWGEGKLTTLVLHAWE